MTIGNWLRLAREKIPALDAELILLFGLKEVLPKGVDRSYLFAHLEVEISLESCQELERMLARRESGEPLAYILGYREFYGRNFRVNSDVLIPRPETEGVVDLVLEALRGDLSGFQAEALCDGGLVRNALKRAKNGVQDDVRVLEVGTGSGCIVVTLSLELTKIGFSGVEIVATDLSEKALAVARKNAQNLEAKVKFGQSDLLENVPNGAKFDVLVANLPYVDEKWDWLDRKSLNFEPKMALYASKHGLGLYERLLEQLVEKKLAPVAVLEIDPCQRLELRKMATEYGWKVLKMEGFGAVLVDEAFCD